MYVWECPQLKKERRLNMDKTLVVINNRISKLEKGQKYILPKHWEVLEDNLLSRINELAGFCDELTGQIETLQKEIEELKEPYNARNVAKN
tara:strand:- start:103 stop:375 length:273 start_codon:yes stop_codon:yes gene_type:complete